MKYPSLILVLAFLLLSIPASFKAQSPTKSKGKKVQKVKRISDEAQVKKIVEQVIDGFFVKRKFLPVFQNLFVPCDKIDKEISYINCDLKDISKSQYKEKLSLRVASVFWRKIFQAYYFVLGTYPINTNLGKESVNSYFFYCKEFDNLSVEVLKKNNVSSIDFNLDFLKNLNKKQIEEKISEIERNVNEIEHLVFNRIDNTLYKKNIEIMRKTIKITPIISENNRTYYLAEIENFIMGFFLTKRNGQLKIVGIGMKDDD